MHKTLLMAALCAVLLAGSAAAQEAEPGDKIKARTAKDVEALMPQLGCGGSDKVQLESVESIIKEIKIEAEGCEQCKGRVSSMIGMDKTRKAALLVIFAWGGLVDAEAMKELAKIAGGSDPMVICTMVYRAEEKVGDNSYRIVTLAEQAQIMAGYSWLLKKMETDFVIDPERRFLMGMGGGDDDALQYASMLWTEDADAFPFRAILLDGMVNSESLDDLPPVPYIVSADKDLIDMNVQFGNKRLPKHFCTDVLNKGLPVQYHEYKAPMMGSPARMYMVHRDAIGIMGGPPAPEYPRERSLPGVVTDADKVPFKDNEDRYANQVIELARQEEWKKANEYMLRVIANKDIAAKDKKAIKAFQKEFDKYVKAEMERCNKSIEISIKAEMWPHWLHHQRLKALYEAFKDEKWAASKTYGANIEKLKTFGPAQRDQERKVKLLDAMKLELAGKRAEAKKIYQEISKQKDADGGLSDWPYAAEYRLTWWVD